MRLYILRLISDDGPSVCIFGVIRSVALSTMKSTDLSCTSPFFSQVKSSHILTECTDNTVYSGIWSYTEISVGIVAACMPTLRPLFKSRRDESKYAGDSTYGSSRPFARWKSSLARSSASKGTDEGDIPLTGTGRSHYMV